MTKLCARGKAAAKRKFKVYPSAYANAYASKICAGKIKDPSGVKRKDFKGPKPSGKVDGGMLKNPKKADLDKDGKLSGYEKKRGMAIEKNMKTKKPVKALGGIFMAKNLLERSQGARDFASGMGLIPRLAADKFQDKADAKAEEERRQRAEAQLKSGPQQMNEGGMVRGQGAAIRGTKFKGVF